MCSSQGLCRGSNRPPSRSSTSGGRTSGSYYALCALGIGLIALGIVMIVWTVIPLDGEASVKPTYPPGNSSTTTVAAPHGDNKDNAKTSTVAFVLVGAGMAIMLLSICLGIRNKRRADNATVQTVAVGVPYTDNVPRDQQDAAEDPPTYDVPSYDEVICSGQYPVRQSNLRQSTSQLPSYEDIIAAVENEGTEPRTNTAADVPPGDPSENPAPASAEPQAVPSLASNPNPNQPTRSTSRASRILKPLRVRRIKSDKLHLKDFRLHIRSPTQNPVTIEPITPPPQYDDKIPELG